MFTTQPLGSKYAPSANDQMAYLMNRTFWKSEPLEKSGPRTYRKSGPYAKIHYIGQKNPYDKLEVADLKYDNNFLNLKLKITNKTRHFWFQVWKFFVLHKTLLNDIFKGAEYACICVKYYVPI